MQHSLCVCIICHEWGVLCLHCPHQAGGLHVPSWPPRSRRPFHFPSLNHLPLHPLYSEVLFASTKWSPAKLNLTHFKQFTFTHLLEASSVPTHTRLIPNSAVQSAARTLHQPVSGELNLWAWAFSGYRVSFEKRSEVYWETDSCRLSSFSVYDLWKRAGSCNNTQTQSETCARKSPLRPHYIYSHIDGSTQCLLKDLLSITGWFERTEKNSGSFCLFCSLVSKGLQEDVGCNMKEQQNSFTFPENMTMRVN